MKIYYKMSHRNLFFDIISFFLNSEPKIFSYNKTEGKINFQELSGSEPK